MRNVFGRKRHDEETDSEITDELFLDIPWSAFPESDSEITDRFAVSLLDELDGDPGPYDFDDVAEQLDAMIEHRLDLGSVILPLPAGFQLQVEMSPDGVPQAVYLTNHHGRLTVAAFAAPKTSGQWREITTDLADALRRENASVSVEQGPWGRELVAVTETTDLRFIGVDGYRWMVRLVAVGPTGSVAESMPLVQSARSVLRETVVRRGTEAFPVRTPLPVVLPDQLAEQLAEAHRHQLEQIQQQAAAAAARQAAAAVAEPVATPAATSVPRRPRRGVEGSAMQQLRR